MKIETSVKSKSHESRGLRVIKLLPETDEDQKTLEELTKTVRHDYHKDRAGKFKSVSVFVCMWGKKKS
jgi:hypothetical protein